MASIAQSVLSRLSITRRQALLVLQCSTTTARKGGGILTRFSTAAALDLEEKEEEPRSSSTSRPRLEALRQELQKEEDDAVDLWNKKKKKNSFHLKKQPVSLDELRKELALLPPLSSGNEMLVDKFQRHHSYLRLSLVEKCNLRCQYCMPPEGVPLQPKQHLLQTDELLELTELFVSQGGVDKVRLTGGEPLLRKDITQLIKGLSQMKNKIKQIGMTTNGVTLSKKKMEELVHAGLTHVNISLDTLNADKFFKLTRRNAFDKVWRSIQVASSVLPPGGGRVKINVVVMRNCNEDELKDFCLLTRDLPVDVRFIEYMPFYDNGWNTNGLVSYQEMLDNIPFELQRVKDGPNDTTKWWTLPPGEESATTTMGRIGFITSMSQHFCGTCNRLRLTADGQIKSCLFGSSELSLRDALRQGWSREEMQKLIHYAVQRKHYALGGHGSAKGIADANDNRPMTLIGG